MPKSSIALRHYPFIGCLFVTFLITNWSYAGHLDKIQFKLHTAGLTAQAKKVGQFKARFPCLDIVIDRWLPERVSPETEALLANLVLYLIDADEGYGNLVKDTQWLKMIADEQRVILEGYGSGQLLPDMTPLDILFELFFVCESYRLSIVRSATHEDEKRLKVALASYLIYRPCSCVPFLRMDPDLTLGQITQHFNALSLLMMLAENSHSSGNAPKMLGAIVSLRPAQQRILSQRILELVILGRYSLHAFQSWLEAQLENDRGGVEILSQLLDNDGSVEGFGATLEKVIPAVRVDSYAPRIYIQPSLMQQPDRYGRYQKPARSDQWQIPDAEGQIRSRIHRLRQERDIRKQEVDSKEPDWVPGAVPTSNRRLMEAIIDALRLLESGEVKGEPAMIYGELIRHLDELDKAYPSRQKFKERMDAVKTIDAKKDFTDKQRAFMARKDEKKRLSQEQAEQCDYELTLLQIKLAAFLLQRGQGRGVSISDAQSYAQDLKALRMQLQHEGSRFGVLSAEQEKRASELCTCCRNIMAAEDEQYLDLRVEHWATLPEQYKEAAGKILEYIIQHFKLLLLSGDDQQASVIPSAVIQSADQSVFTDTTLLEDAFNRLNLPGHPVEHSVLPVGVCRCPVAKDNYCFYQALATAMGLGITGEALFQQIILLAQNTLNDSPQTLSLLNSILASSMSSIQELASLAFVEYSGVQMWGHTGMLPLIAWWFNASVLVTTPATWEGSGALLFLADGTWEFVYTEVAGGLHTIEMLQASFPSLAVIENADNHWSVLKIEDLARTRRR